MFASQKNEILKNFAFTSNANASTLERNYNLNANASSDHHRKTHIICTLGPASQNIDTLQKMFEAGMDIARLNFSHGTHEYHLDTIKAIREAEQALLPLSRSVAIALDTKGPEIRTGLINGSSTNEADLIVGEIIRVSSDKVYRERCNETIIYVDYANIVETLNVTSPIYIDDGLICIRVKEKGPNYLDCIIEKGGILGSSKGVNLPGASVDLPCLSEKDKIDIQFALDNNLDIIFASFIRDAKGIHAIRELLGERGAYIKIIAKIESQQGVDNFDEILQAADGIMVARGDLGIEIPPEKVFLVQKMAIARCNVLGKPCICATQMLESMTYKPSATRAESSDVANAVLDGADCVMLSGETAKGKYPVECVRTMATICKEAEAVLSRTRICNDLRQLMETPVDTTHATAIAAVEASLHSLAKGIVCLTSTGTSAQMIARHRPRCPIFAVTRSGTIARQLNLWSGCFPIHYQEPKADLWSDEANRCIACAIEHGRYNGILQDRDRIVVTAGWKGEPGSTNTVRIIELGSLAEHNIIGVPDLRNYKD